MFGGKARSRLLVEGLGVKESHSDSLQAEPPFNIDGAKFAARKVAWHQRLGTEHSGHAYLTDILGTSSTRFSY